MTYLLNKQTQLNNYFLELNSNGIYTTQIIYGFVNIKLNKSIVIKNKNKNSQLCQCGKLLLVGKKKSIIDPKKKKTNKNLLI